MLLSSQTLPKDVRAAIRSGAMRKPTAGIASGYIQANIVVLPRDDAADFLRFCQRNPKPCPVLSVSEPGDPFIKDMGDDIDIRTDVPLYRVFRDGEMIAEPHDVSEYWRNDLVSFVIGCSFAFEHALVDAGIGIRHIEQGRNVPMYRTNIETRRAGKFSAPTVVTMRPFKAADAIRAIQISSRFPDVHGAPVHIGDPKLIGIEDLSRPDYGDAVDLYPDEIPVFWACGVTPQAALENARPSLCITHSPGYMLITDRLNAEYSVL